MIYAVNNAGTSFYRFPNDPAFQQGFESGGGLLGQASLVLGGYGRPVPEAPYDPESEIENAMDQESDLEHWARSNDCWHTHPQEYYKGLSYQFYGFGGEAQVYADGDRKNSRPEVVPGGRKRDQWGGYQSISFPLL